MFLQPIAVFRRRPLKSGAWGVALLASGFLLIGINAGMNACAAASATGSATSTATGPAPSGLVSGASASERTRPFLPGEKQVYFTNIQNGDQVRSPFRVAFSVTGMGVAPVKAGMMDGTGHHHILIDLPIPADIKAPIPFDAPNEFLHQHYKHFGGGETETVLNLPPGKHTLRLLFADASHVPYYMDSQVITITVLPPEK